MPVITIEGPKISKEQKSRLVKEIVPKLSEIYNIPEQSFVTFIKENDYDNVATGSELLSERFSKTDK